MIMRLAVVFIAIALVDLLRTVQKAGARATQRAVATRFEAPAAAAVQAGSVETLGLPFDLPVSLKEAESQRSAKPKLNDSTSIAAHVFSADPALESTVDSEP